MSVSVGEQTDDQRMELRTAINVPLILATSLVLMVLIVTVAVDLLGAPKTGPAPTPQAAIPPPEKMDNFLPAQLEPQSQMRESRPDPAIAAPEQSFKRRSPYSEKELRECLIKASREVDVETEKGTTAKLLKGEIVNATSTKGAEKDTHKTPPIVELIAQRADLKGLPVRNVSDCQLPEKEAKIMRDLSRTVRSSRIHIEIFHLDEMLKNSEWSNDTGVRLLVQMFQTEDHAVQMRVIKILAATEGPSASVALAQRAVFDFSPDIRQVAVEALSRRPPAEWRPVLLNALRYPWSVVADNAAEALVALNDRDAVPDLARLLDKPDPQAPTQNKERKWVAAELVRVNHLGNCVLCHAPCSAQEDTVRGLVPERGKPLPVEYYESQDGSFVRAEVTYLKQDFSILQSVAEPGQWPRLQRFDYLIRQRELSDAEVSEVNAAKALGADNPTPYPQRAAVLWALRELTGVNIGPRSEDWNHYLQCQKKGLINRNP